MSTPARIRVGAAVLRGRDLVGPERIVRLDAQTARLLARLAATPGRVVPWPEAIETLYSGAVPDAGDPRAVARVRLRQVRAALREAATGAGVSTVFATGVRLDVPALADGARVECRPVTPRQAGMVRAREQGVAPADLAERFGLPGPNAASMAVSRARRRMREAETARTAGVVP